MSGPWPDGGLVLSVMPGSDDDARRLVGKPIHFDGGHVVIEGFELPVGPMVVAEAWVERGMIVARFRRPDDMPVGARVVH